MLTRLAMLVGIAALLPTLSACAGSLGYMPPVGVVYAGGKGINPSTQAHVTDGVRPGPKTGQACTMGVVGVASWGDMSLEAAKKNGGITRVDTLDYKTMDILGVVYQKHCTIITGE
jgi:hypothetical protein